jgi:hypothetical protein
VLWAAIAVGVLIIGGAIVLKPKLTTAPAVAPAPVASGAPTAEGTGSAPPAVGGGTQAPTTPVTGEPAGQAARARQEERTAPPGAGAGAAAAPAGVPLPTASLEKRATDPAPAPAASAAPAPPSDAVRAAPAEPTPGLTDARAAARAFVTMMNQRRGRDLERLADAGGGEPDARRSLERLVRDGDDFAAGFDRMASAPDAEGSAFMTEFVVEASWLSGGREMAALFEVRLRLARQGGNWVADGYSVRAR